MGRHLFFSYFSALFLLAQTLDSEHNEPTYKFGILAGEPTSLNASTAVTVASFDECVEKCLDDFECILASQNASTAPCNLFKWNTVTGVRTNESGGEGLVAFRLFTDQPACDLNLPLLLNGKTYQLYPNDTEEYLWRIDTSEEGFNITYIRTRQDENLICGNWSFNRPYSDGCNQECLLSMVQVFGEPGPLTQYYQNGLSGHLLRKYNATSWQSCMDQCYAHVRCVVVFYREDSNNCTWFAPEDETYLTRKTTAAEGLRGAFKVKLNNESCKYTTEKLLEGTYFMTNRTEVFSVSDSRRINNDPVFEYLPFWRLQAKDEYYQLKFFENETIARYGVQAGCGLQMFPSGYQYGHNAINRTFCYRPFQWPGLTYPLAKKYCELIDGVLMPEFNKEMWNIMESGLPIRSFFLGPDNEWGFQPNFTIVPQHPKIWAGIEKDPECYNVTNSYCRGNQMWVFSDPSLPVYFWNFTEKTLATEISWSWAPGQPDVSPDKNCVYYELNENPLVNGVGLNGWAFQMYTTACDATNIDGFACVLQSQTRLGVPKYADMMAAFNLENTPVTPWVYNPDL